MDLPVEVVDQSGERRVAALVDVIDGQGAFWVPGRADDVEVELDPMGLSLAYARDVSWVKNPSCERPSVTAEASPMRQPDPEVEEVLEPEVDEVVQPELGEVEAPVEAELGEVVAPVAPVEAGLGNVTD